MKIWKTIIYLEKENPSFPQLFSFPSQSAASVQLAASPLASRQQIRVSARGAGSVHPPRQLQAGFTVTLSFGTRKSAEQVSRNEVLVPSLDERKKRGRRIGLTWVWMFSKGCGMIPYVDSRFVVYTVEIADWF